MKFYELYDGNNDEVINEGVTLEEVQNYLKSLYVIDSELEESNENRVMSIYELMEGGLI